LSRPHTARRIATSTAAVTLALFATLPLAGSASAAEDLDCKDFVNQAAAQAHYDANPSDPDRLDADDDREACENHDYSTSSGSIGASTSRDEPASSGSIGAPTSRDEPASSNRVGARIATVPRGAVAAGDGSGTGADPEAVAAATLGGIAAIGVAGGVFLLRRRVRDGH
jgi:hypothetical protein